MKPKRTWQRANSKPSSKPKIADDVRMAVDAQVALVVADLVKRYCKTPTNPQFNWCIDIFTRWHREALYFVAVMRTPHDRPPTFETHAARMQHAGDGKFDLAVPMRRGWNTVKQAASAEECLKEVSDLIYL
jgi:hypothetical protein